MTAKLYATEETARLYAETAENEKQAAEARIADLLSRKKEITQSFEQLFQGFVHYDGKNT